MRKRRSFVKDITSVSVAGSSSGGLCSGSGLDGSDQSTPEHQSEPHLTHHPHQHHSTLPPLSDAYEKSSREFEDIFDIDIDTLPPSFFAEALGSLIGENGDSSLLNEDIFLDACSSRCVKRCYSAPPSPLSGLLADFDEQSSMMDLITETQAAANSSINSLPVNPSDSSISSVVDQPAPWAALSTNDVIDVLEAATHRLTAEQLQQEATAAVEAKINQQQGQIQQISQTPQNSSLLRPPSAPPPTTYEAPLQLPMVGSLSTRSDDAFTIDEFTVRHVGTASNEWRQPRRPRSTVPTAASLIVPISAIRPHDIVRSRLASLASRRLREKVTRASSSSDRSPMSISSDQFPFSTVNSASFDFEVNRRSSSSTPCLTLTPQQTVAPSSLATLLTNNSGNQNTSNGSSNGGINNGTEQALPSRSFTSIATSNGSNNGSNGLVVVPPTNSLSISNSTDLYRCIYPNCSLSYDRPARLHAHLLHHVYGMTGPYRCDVPVCSSSVVSSQSSAITAASSSTSITSTSVNNNNNNSGTAPIKLTRTFPTTKQLWGHIESTHPEIIENKGVQPVDFTALRHKTPLSCPSCDSSFVYPFQLFLHLRSVHVRPSHRSNLFAEKRSRLQTPAEYKTQNVSSSFACRLCSFQSSTMSGLLLHLQRKQHQRQAARKYHPSSNGTVNVTVNGGSGAQQQLLVQPQTQPRLVFRGSSSFMLQHTTPSSVISTTKPKVVSPELPANDNVPAVQNTPTAFLVDANALKSVLIVSPANNGTSGQETPQLSSEAAASPFYLLQRVVLVHVSH